MYQLTRMDQNLKLGEVGVQAKRKKRKKKTNKHLYSINKLSIKTNTQNYFFFVHLDAIIYQQRQKTQNAIIYAISIFRFTSFQFINLFNLEH